MRLRRVTHARKGFCALEINFEAIRCPTGSSGRGFRARSRAVHDEAGPFPMRIILKSASDHYPEQEGFAVPACPADHESRQAAFLESLEERVLVLDGATGTALQGVHLTAEDFGGPDLEGCNEMLCRTRPDVVAGVHHAYLRADCDIVETNSFGSTPLVLAEYDVPH